jgi:hypothetical protein
MLDDADVYAFFTNLLAPRHVRSTASTGGSEPR